MYIITWELPNVINVLWTIDVTKTASCGLWMEFVDCSL
jgi:hypothetical protein